MSQVFFIKSGSTAPAISGTLYDGNNDVVNLSNATGIVFKMAPSGSATSVVSGAGSIGSPASGGGWSYQWVSGDTATPGEYEGEVHVTWNSGTTQVFPSDGYIPVVIEQSKS